MTEGLSSRRYRGLPPEARQADRQHRLRSAALELFSSVGYLKSSVPEICRRAGLSTRQFYAEFSSREALLIDLYRRFQAQARGAVRTAFADAEDRSSRGLIIAALSAYVDALSEDPRVARIVLIETVGVSAEVDAARAEVLDRWLVVVNEQIEGMTAGRSAGAPTGPGPSAAWAAMAALAGAVHGLVREIALGDGGVDRDTALAVAIPIVDTLLMIAGTDDAPA